MDGQNAALCPSDALAGVDFDLVHCGKIDHGAAITDTQTRAVVPANAHCNRYVVALCKIKSTRDVVGVRASHD